MALCMIPRYRPQTEGGREAPPPAAPPSRGAPGRRTRGPGAPRAAPHPGKGGAASRRRPRPQPRRRGATRRPDPERKEGGGNKIETNPTANRESERVDQHNHPSNDNGSNILAPPPQPIGCRRIHVIVRLYLPGYLPTATEKPKNKKRKKEQV